MNNETRAEWDREVYDHERMTGQHAAEAWRKSGGICDDALAPAEVETPEPETLATFTLQILGPASEGLETRFSLTDKRVLADLPAMLESVEEDLSDLLPEGYSAVVKEWNAE